MTLLPRSPLACWSWTIALAGLAAGTWGLVAAKPFVLLIGGDTQGSLAPCGCTEPMTGGVKRLATAVRLNRGAGPSGFIENGGMVRLSPEHGAVGRRQNELKAQALAEAFAAMGVDAINLGPEEASSGAGMVSEIVALSGQRAVSTSVDGASLAIPRWAVAGPCLVGGVSMSAFALAEAANGIPVTPDVAANSLVAEATAEGRTPVLMLRGTLDQARVLAKSVPGLRLIVYATSGTAPPASESLGETLLVSPGSETKNLIRLELLGGRFSAYSVITLDPAVPDDAKVTRLYRDYLKRVSAAQLIEALPRVKTAAFVGSEACLKCHKSAYTVWHSSAHAHALADLEKKGHDRDPDCLGCHVTGLTSLRGFVSRLTTPKLANVTCESCHGPGAAHSLDPRRLRLPKLTESACLPCHTPENSPGFQFLPFWKKVIHRN